MTSERIGTTSRVISTIFRFTELTCAAIVTCIAGRYLYYADRANVGAGSRMVYTVAIGSISLFFALVFLVPFKYGFYGFPLDLILFVLWIVDFGLLEGLVGTSGCSSWWYWNHWGYYWGNHWTIAPTRSLVGHNGCSKWRALVAFSFISSWFWLMSGILGLYVCYKLSKRNRAAEDMVETGQDKRVPHRNDPELPATTMAPGEPK